MPAPPLRMQETAEGLGNCPAAELPGACRPPSKSTLLSLFFGSVHWPFTCLGPCRTFMINQALQYYMHDGSTSFRFELAGNLNNEGAHKLDQAWRTASSVIGDRRLSIEMTFVTCLDAQGRALVARWHREGAQLVANSIASRALAES